MPTCSRMPLESTGGLMAPTAVERAPLLARLCVALAYADEANEKLDATGLLVKAPNTGFPIQSPYLAVLNKQAEIARKLAAELALPPAQRDRVRPVDPARNPPSLWDELEVITS